MALKILVSHDGMPDRGDVFPQDEVLVGSEPGNDVVLPFAGIDKRHARVVLRDGRVILVDCKSTGGTFVGGRRVTSPCVLRPDDVVTIGPCRIVAAPVVATASVAPSPAAASAVAPTGPSAGVPPAAVLEVRRAVFLAALKGLAAPDGRPAADEQGVARARATVERVLLLLQKKLARLSRDGAVDGAAAGGVGATNATPTGPTIVVTVNKQVVLRHPVTADEVVIGRDPKCQVHLDNRALSRMHARISRRGTSFWLADLKSQNGTYVNEARLTEPRQLRAGDIVTIGRYELSLEDVGATANYGDEATIRAWTSQITDELCRLGPLGARLDDPSVVAIEVREPDEVYVERRRVGAPASDGLQREPVFFSAHEAVTLVAIRLIEAAGRTFDASAPAIDVTLSDGTRVVATAHGSDRYGRRLAISRASIPAESALRSTTMTTAAVREKELGDDIEPLPPGAAE